MFRLAGGLVPPRFAFQLGARRLPLQMARAVFDDFATGSGGRDGAFVIEIPKLTREDPKQRLKDTMLVSFVCCERLDPRKVYALFVLFQFDDYGPLRSIGVLLRWVGPGGPASIPAAACRCRAEKASTVMRSSLPGAPPFQANRSRVARWASCGPMIGGLIGARKLGSARRG